MTLEDVLAFATGCTEIPVTGFEPQPNLCFNPDGSFPTASTCGPTLRLPFVTAQHEFCINMRLAVLGSCGFGQV